MKRLLAFLVLLLLLPSVAQAQNPNEVGIFGDLNGDTTQIVVSGFVPFHLYVIALGLTGDIQGWEASITMPPVYIPLTITLDQPTSVNVAGSQNYVVGSGGCFAGAPDYRLLTLELLYPDNVAPADELFCVGFAQPTSFIPAAPGYLQCDSALTALSLVDPPTTPPGCLVVNSPDFCGPPLEAQLASALSDEVGRVGELVPMPVQFGKQGYIDCPVFDFDVFEMEIHLQWDQAIATLEDVVAGPALPGDWTVQFTVDAERAILDLQGPTGYNPTEWEVLEQILELRWRVENAGHTDVLYLWEEGGAYDADQNLHVIFPWADGSLSTSVPVESASFGALKARFGSN